MKNPENLDRRSALTLLAGSVTAVGLSQFDSALANDAEDSVDKITRGFDAVKTAAASL